MDVKPKTQTNHRQGTMVAFIDLIQELISLEFPFRQDHLVVSDRALEIIHQLREFDSETIGHLYLTSGGRVVLDKGYGEYFNTSDKVLFTLEELKRGIPYRDFIGKLVANEI